MVLSHLPYSIETKGGLAHTDSQLYHFCLAASSKTINKRLLERADIEDSWPWQRVERNVHALSSPEFEVHIDTEDKEPSEVVKSIPNHLKF